MMEPKESKSKRHFWISFFKSQIRIAGFVVLACGYLLPAGVALCAAEALGILEEL